MTKGGSFAEARRLHRQSLSGNGGGGERSAGGAHSGRSSGALHPPKSRYFDPDDRLDLPAHALSRAAGGAAQGAERRAASRRISRLAGDDRTGRLRLVLPYDKILIARRVGPDPGIAVAGLRQAAQHRRHGRRVPGRGRATSPDCASWRPTAAAPCAARCRWCAEAADARPALTLPRANRTARW